MAENGQIEIDVSVDGSAQAVRDLGAVTSAFAGFAQQTSTTAQRVQGVAGSVQALVGALGSRDRTAGLVASVAGATAQFAAMGSMLGPGGTLVGAVVGFTASLLSMARANDDVAASARSARQELASLANQRIADRAAESMERRIATGELGGVGVSDLEREREVRRIEIERLEEEYDAARERARRARETYEGAGRSVPEGIRRSIMGDVERLREERSALMGEIDNINEELGERAGSLGSSAGGGASARGGGGSRTAPTAPGQSGDGGQDSASRSRNTEQENELARRRELMEERLDLVRETSDAELDIELENLERYGEALREASEERKALEVAEFEKRQELEAASMAAREETIGEWTGMLGNVTTQFGKTLGAIATGEKTAEEAFKGLAASFLEMISQYASLKAATEFADAAASFARYDYGGGAAHIGAGVAFTAVAIATGIGAAAINQPPQQPAKPEAAQSTSGGGGGGDVNIFWNSPVVTSATEAELGRNLRQMLAAGGA